MENKTNEVYYGLILARKGSKGIPNKNLAELNGEPLVIRTARIMDESCCFKEIWVSTDCEDVSKLVKNKEFKVHRRADYTATDQATSLTAVQEFLNSHLEIENVCLAQCTSPFIKENYLKEGLKKFQNFDSVFTVTRKHLLRWSEESPRSPINFELKSRPRRQEFLGDLCENGMFYYCRRNFVLNDGVLQGGRCEVVEVDSSDSMDIDTPMDLFLAQQVLNYRQSYGK